MKLGTIGTVGAMGALLAVGVREVWRARPSGPAPTQREMVAADVRTPTRSVLSAPTALFEDGLRRSTIVGLLEVFAVLVAAVGLGTLVAVVQPSPAVVALAVANFLVGVYVVGQEAGTRLGLLGPTGTDTRATGSVAAFEAAVSEFVDPATAADFDRLAGATVRAADGPAAVDIAVVAAARNGCSVDRVADWAEAAGVDRPRVEARLDELSAAGVVDTTGDRLDIAHDRLAEADPREVASVVASLGA
jgi:hypothetical protein